MKWKKLAVVLAISLIAPTAVLWFWLHPQLHQEVASPDGRWLVQIWKQRHFGVDGVNVCVRVIRDDGGCVIEEVIDIPDSMGDFTSKDYLVAWTSPTEFIIGGRSKEDNGYIARYSEARESWEITLNRNKR